MDQTIIKQVDFDDLTDLFPTAESVVTVPEEKKVNPTVLSNTEKKVDLDPLTLKREEEEKLRQARLAEEAKKIAENLIPSLDDELPGADPAPDTNRGRAKTDKNGLVELVKSRIEKNQMIPFDDYKDGDDLGEYLAKFSMKDFEDLWEANLERQKAELEEQVPSEFFGSLPTELQWAAKYVADGGTDLKGLFRALAQGEETKELDPETHSREIAIQYLRATNFGTEDEIREQVDEWEDMSALKKKAQSFKPKLDKMQDTLIQQRLEQQEQDRLRREEASKVYFNNVKEALKTPEIGGIKLDKKTHDFLVQGLLNPAWTSQSGRNTNLLGYLLEQHQIVKPNYPLVAEALWLLADPEGYRARMTQVGKNAATEQTIRQLKTEQSKRQSASLQEEEENTSRSVRRLPQRGNSIFKRNI